MKPLVKFTPTSPPLFFQEIGTEKYLFLVTQVNFTYVCVLSFSNLEEVGTQKCRLM